MVLSIVLAFCLQQVLSQALKPLFKIQPVDDCLITISLRIPEDAASCVNGNGSEDHASYVQLQAQRPMDFTLARIDWPVNISLPDNAFVIYSAVPVWGDESYIALLPDSAHSPRAYLKRGDGRTLEFDRLESYLLRNPIYCKGDWSGGKERRQVDIKGRALSCPWTSDDKDKAVIEVKLEDREGNALGTVLAKQVLLGQHSIMACIRDVYDDSEHLPQQRPFSGPFKQLVEWLEFHAMSGVDHFLFYTFRGSTEPMLQFMKPYVEAGMATRVHFDYSPVEAQFRQGFLSNDCLFRAKNHAKWIMPTVDVDEYLYTVDDLTHPTDFSGLFERILNNSKKTIDEVNAMRFQRQRFVRVSQNGLEIEATRVDKGWRGLPKSVVNPALNYHVSVHDVDCPEPGTETLMVPESVAWIRHYNDGPSHLTRGENGETEDYSLKGCVPKLENALLQRWKLKSKEQLKSFLVEAATQHPSHPADLKSLDPFPHSPLSRRFW